MIWPLRGQGYGLIDTKKRILLQEVFNMIDHFLTTVGSDFNNTCIHANCVFWTSFYAETTEHTNTEINVEADRKFLNIGIRMLTSQNINTVCRAYCFTHHTGNTAESAIVSFTKSVSDT